jgi:gluconate kinase
MPAENPKPEAFQNWLPSTLFEKDGNLFLTWIYLGDVHFNLPFFDETLCQCHTANSIKGGKQNEKRITPIEFLTEVAQHLESVEPGLIIFHTSRCGSTLATQLLSLDKVNIVVPEYVIIDSILRATINGEAVSEEKRKNWLLNCIKVIGQKRFTEEKRLIIKLDSWHFGFYELFRALYPNVPFVMLYREPDAILRSNSKKWGMQFLPDIVPSKLFTIEIDSLSPFSLIDYSNRVLQSMYRSIAEIASTDRNCLLLDYRSGVARNMDQLTGLMKTEPSFMNRNDVKERMKFHSKQPDVNFEKEDQSQARLATEETINAYKQLGETI